MKTKPILILLLLLGGCSGQQRLNRVLKKNPDLIKSDTVVTHDTLTTVIAEADTMLLTHEYHYSDTLVLQKEKLTVKVVNNYHDSTIYIQGECAPDTLVIQGESITRTLTVEPDWLIKARRFASYWWVVLLVVSTILVVRFFIKLNNPF